MTDEKRQSGDSESQSENEATLVQDLEIKDAEDAEAVTGGAAGVDFKENIIKTGP